MEVYKFKCDNCGSKSCEQIDDVTYKCLFCGQEQKIFIDKTKTENNEQKTDENQDSGDAITNVSKKVFTFFDKNQSLVLMLLTIFFGWFGIQKFIKGKIVMGFVYLFTFGIFCIGWLLDVISSVKEYRAVVLGAEETKENKNDAVNDNK